MILSHKYFRSIDGRFTNLVISCTAREVEATLVYYEHNSPRKILMQTKRALSVDPLSEEELFAHTLETLHELCKDVAQQSYRLFAQSDLFSDHQQIHEVTMFLSAPWVHTRFYNQNKTWSKPASIGVSEINALLPTQIPQGHTRLDTHVVNLRVNGYQVNPSRVMDMHGVTLDLSALDMTMRIDQAETLFQVVHTHFNLLEEQFHILSTLSAMTSYLHEEYKPNHDHISLSVYGTYSDVVVWQNNAITHAGSIEFGSQTILQTIREAGLVQGQRQSESLLQLYTHGNLSEREVLRVHNTFTQFVSTLEQAIQSLGDQAYTRGTVSARDWYVFSPHQRTEFFVPLLDEVTPGRVVQVKARSTPTVGSLIDSPLSDLSQILVAFVAHHNKDIIIR